MRYAGDRAPIHSMLDPFPVTERYSSSPPILFVSYFLFIFLSLSIFLFSFNFLFPRMETKDGIRGRAVAREGKLGDESPPIESVEKEKATS